MSQERSRIKGCASAVKGRRSRVGKRLPVAMIALAALGLGACAETQLAAYTVKRMGKTGEETGTRKIGRPYQIAGRWYYPAANPTYDEVGIASWYGPNFHGRPTANGEVYDMDALTAAHTTLPLPSIVRVTNLENGRSVLLRVNDRGPFVKDRLIDVSRRAAQLLGFAAKGTARVRVENVTDRVPEGFRPDGRVAYGEPAPLPGESNKPKVVQAVARIEQPPTPEDERQARAVPRGEVVAAELPSLISKAEAAPMATGGHYVQVGAFRDAANARSLELRLSSRFGAVNVMPTRIDGGTFYRVRLGPFEREELADAVLDELARAGYGNAAVVSD